MLNRRLLSAIVAMAGLFFGGVCDAWAQDATFTKANDHYKNGEYNEAIAAYASILDEGRESAALHFNLGNSYFRNHQLGRALVSYERARRLHPRDPEIQTNLRLARSRRTYARPPQASLLKKMTDLPFTWFSLDEWTAGVLASYLGLMVFLCFMTVRPAQRNGLRTPARVLAIIFLLGMSVMYVKINGHGREALVVRRRTEALFAPFEKATAHFELSEGMSVAVLEERPGWLKVERPDGKNGWVPDKDLAVI